MERMQPPPNYYGVPYPNQMDVNGQPSQYPNMGPKPPYPNPNDINGSATREDEDDAASDVYFTKILAKHKGKKMTIYCSFTDAAEWHDKVFKGTLVSAGDDYVIIEDKSTKKEILILSVYIHFIEYDE